VDGSWRGVLPACSLPSAGAPTQVVATAFPSGVVSVRWAAPTALGYAPTLLAYEVSSVPTEVYETFAQGRFPAPIAPVGVDGAGSYYVGGNWHALREKGTPPNPATTLSNIYVNAWDFWNGYLRIDNDGYKINSYDQNDNLVLFRDMPAGLDVSGAWATEAFVALDTVNIISVSGMSACLSINNMGNYGGLGNAEMYLCVTNGNAAGSPYTISFEQGQGKWGAYYGTQTFPGNPSAAYLRIERDPSVTPTRWRGFFKFNQADAWNSFVTVGTDYLTRGASMPPALLRPSLLTRSWSLQGRAIGLYSSFRIGPTTCVDVGSQRLVSASASSALIYGLTQGTAYSFSVRAQTPAGWGAASAASAAVVIPLVAASTGALPLLSQGQPCSANSIYSAANPCSFAFDGDVATFAHNNCNLFTDGLGGWFQVDLGATRAINLVKVVCRQDAANVNRCNDYVIIVSATPNFLLPGAQTCDTTQYSPNLGGQPGFTSTFPCYAPGGSGLFLSGRYVTIRRGIIQTDLCFNLAELQVFGSPPTPLVSQGLPCSMSSTPADGSARCDFAVDGNVATFARNNGDSTAAFPYGWLTVDLGISTAISSVTLTAIAPGLGASRLNGFSIIVGDSPTPFSTNVNIRNAPCNQSYVPFSLAALPGNTSTFACVPSDGFGWRTGAVMTGRYVTMQLAASTPAGSTFAVSELRVNAANLVLISQFKKCWMSSVYSQQVCDFAFDGDASQQLSNMAQTNADLDDYITVDFGVSSAVRLVKVYNRRDASANYARLNFMQVFVGDNLKYSANPSCDTTTYNPLWTLAAGQANAWSMTFPCALTGRYATFHIPGGGNDFINVMELQYFAANGCSQRTASGATQVGGSVCQAAGWGQVCAHECLPGWVQVSGSESSTCTGTEWDEPSLVCLPPCPELLAPAYSDSCQQTLFSDDFNIDGSLARFVSLTPQTQKVGFPGSAPPQKSKWFQIDAQVQASSYVSCESDLNLAIASNRISTYDGGFTLQASVSTQTVAGLFFHALDDLNMMRFWFDARLQYGRLERLVANKPLLIADASSFLFTAGAFHTVSISVQGALINVTFDGQLVLSSADGTFIVGAAGLYAQSSATFDNLVFASSCASCRSMTDGDVCTFRCQPGLLSVGPVSRTCAGRTSIASMAFSPDLLARPLLCTLPAPSFPSAVTLLVVENSVKNALVGDPLAVTSAAPDYQLLFQVTHVYAMGAYGVAPSNFTQALVPNQALFYIDACSGQVKLRTGGSGANSAFPNFEGVNSFAVTVRAFISGFPGAEAVSNVTVHVLNVDEPPFVLPTTVLLPENAAVALGA
jgi:hypothetical protein